MEKDTFYQYVDYDYTEMTPIWECNCCKTHYCTYENDHNYCPTCGCKIQAWKGEEEYWNKTKKTK